ncbi:MAG: nucleotidyltransferase family protein [Alphaproteobacteria bacterium]
MTGPSSLATAMVLAAGRGKRLRPFTDTTPKPLATVAGQTLIDHVLDRLAAAGVGHAVVNLWYLGQMIEDHLSDRREPRITFSREDDLLDTGGGVVRALPKLGSDAFFVLSSDTLWHETGTPALERLAAAWDDGAMDALLLLQPLEGATGFAGTGDFFMDNHGRLSRRGGATTAPFAYMSVQIMHPRAFDGCPAGAFSNNLIWDRSLAAGRLFGLVHHGHWFHVGDPDSLAVADRLMS